MPRLASPAVSCAVVVTLRRFKRLPPADRDRALIRWVATPNGAPLLFTWVAPRASNAVRCAAILLLTNRPTLSEPILAEVVKSVVAVGRPELRLARPA